MKTLEEIAREAAEEIWNEPYGVMVSDIQSIILRACQDYAKPAVDLLKEADENPYADFGPGTRDKIKAVRALYSQDAQKHQGVCEVCGEVMTDDTPMVHAENGKIHESCQDAQKEER